MASFGILTVMLKLYIYGYLNRVPSSRRLERECQRNIELIWLTEQLAPDFKTIADFRKDNGKAIREVCREFVALCRKLDLLGASPVPYGGEQTVHPRHSIHCCPSVVIQISAKACRCESKPPITHNRSSPPSGDSTAGTTPTRAVNGRSRFRLHVRPSSEDHTSRDGTMRASSMLPPKIHSFLWKTAEMTPRGVHGAMVSRTHSLPSGDDHTSL
jgi:hypothetical protein